MIEIDEARPVKVYLHGALAELLATRVMEKTPDANTE